MFELSPRFFLSPRFLALPAIALAVIVALAQAHSGTKSTGTEVAAPTVIKAGTCNTPAKSNTLACAVASDDRVVAR
jgi:hypothetical protein